MVEVEKMLERSPQNSNLFIVFNHLAAARLISTKTKQFLTHMGATAVND